MVWNRCTNAKINFREKEKEVLDQILGAGMYDARIRPSGVNGTGKEYCFSKIYTKFRLSQAPGFCLFLPLLVVHICNVTRCPSL